ncbi:MAG: bifunctional adenosylcobinamide kinase/adenosylcobinamide-phosphate guanylyltransferase [Spirochaetia bacterium]|nr:bifunctional adenosylcobinamide kinase/adenosylcobinamide-phosphate guanylyltransferase [Spirochaetia bacterium]
MRVFICGGAGAGKSAFAESVAQKLGGRLVYVATMPVVSDEDRAKVERHHRLRAGKGFTTIEQPGRLEELPDNGETMLIECLSTHVANMMFNPGNSPTDAAQNADCLHPGCSAAADTSSRQSVAHWSETIKAELAPLLKRKGNTIFVSLEITSDGTTYSPETEAYKSVLTAVNSYLVQNSDAAFEVVCGIPVKIKGELPCLKV